MSEKIDKIIYLKWTWLPSRKISHTVEKKYETMLILTVIKIYYINFGNFTFITTTLGVKSYMYKLVMNIEEKTVHIDLRCNTQLLYGVF